MARNIKCISFCLYGENPLYSDGLIENLKFCNIVYPTWQPIVYLEERKDAELRPVLQSHGAQVVAVQGSHLSERQLLIQGMFWRLKALSISDASHVIFRDCDSRVSQREALAVQCWLDSNKDFHFMYDHLYHTVPILGGMWGCRGGMLPDIETTIECFHSRFAAEDPYWPQCDQSFLKEFVWNTLVQDNNYLAHGSQELRVFYQDNNIHVVPFPTNYNTYNNQDSHGGFVGKTVMTSASLPKPQKK